MTGKVKKSNNKGLTLVELLVAVTILGIIVAPLLHTFVTSAYTARKSREYGDATTAAQNIIEAIEALDTDVLLKSTNVDALLINAAGIDAGASFYERSVTDGVVHYGALGEGVAPVKDADSKYYIGLPVSSGHSQFDALVTLDASSEINEKPVTEYTELIATTQATGADNPDYMAKLSFDEACADKNGTGAALSRRITITVGKQILDDGGATARYPISIVYTYTGGFTFGTEHEYYSFFDEYTSETHYTANTGDLADDKPLFSIYYFFDTFYGYGSTTDTVYVNNKANNSGPGSFDLRFNLFLVRQKTPETAAREDTYKSSIIQYEPYGLGETVDEHGVRTYHNSCKIYTNLNTNLNTGGEIPAFGYFVYRDSIWYNPGTAEPKLVVSNTLDRLLYINVQLFPRGAGFSENAVASINATKID